MDIGTGLAWMGGCLMVGMIVFGALMAGGREAIGRGLYNIGEGLGKLGHEYRMVQREIKSE